MGGTEKQHTTRGHNFKIKQEVTKPGSWLRLHSQLQAGEDGQESLRCDGEKHAAQVGC